MNADSQNKRLTSLLWIKIAYVLAAGAGIAVGYLLWGEDQWLVVLAADLAATVVIFTFSVIFKNASFYDAYWSIIPIWIAIFLFLFPESQVESTRALITGALVFLWGARLTWNWWRGWTGLNHEDWRYVDLRKKTGKLFPLVNFSGIQLFPTVLVFLGCLPLFAVLSERNTPLNWIDFLGFGVTLGAILIEAVADQQLRRFRLGNSDPMKILDTGLWKYSRHPNYFGELSFWYGLFIIGLGAAPDEWWRGVGALAMTILFVFISIPMIDKRMLAKRPHYAERKKRVSGLIPWPPKNG